MILDLILIKLTSSNKSESGNFQLYSAYTCFHLVEEMEQINLNFMKLKKRVTKHGMGYMLM